MKIVNNCDSVKCPYCKKIQPADLGELITGSDVEDEGYTKTVYIQECAFCQRNYRIIGKFMYEIKKYRRAK